VVQPYKSCFAGGQWRSADWILPLSVSLCLHLMLLGLLALRDNQPPEIVWIRLLDANVPPDKTREHGVRAPAARASLRQQPPLSPPAPRLPPEQPVKSAAVRSDQSIAALPATPAFAPGGEMIGTASTGTVVEEDKSPVTSAADDNAMPVPLPGPTETVEQRYLREQFAYIRERVMERLIYPPLARRQGLTGQVRVEFTICADGSVEGLKIAVSSGRSLLDQQAVRAVQAAAPFPSPPAPARITLPVFFTVELSNR
jgi:periplasmic protein TonB